MRLTRMIALVCIAAPFAAQAADGDWTGTYGGVQVGLGQVAVDMVYSQAGLLAADPNAMQSWREGAGRGGGAIAGAHLGWNRQLGDLVYGIEAGFDGGDLSNSNAYHDDIVDTVNPSGSRMLSYAGTFTETVHRTATLTGRIGRLVSPSTLIYAKAGAASSDRAYDETVTLTTEAGTGLPGEYHGRHTVLGWTLGAGVEHKISSKLSVFAEYDYFGFGARPIKMPLTEDPAQFETLTASGFNQSVQLGINFRF